jgi:hypothetical protein
MLSFPRGIDVGALCDELNSLPFVELATPAPKPAPPPIDIPPPTPDFSGMQGYRAAPPGGIGALDPALGPGGDGAGTTVVDVEYSWVLDHEDLELDASANIDTQATLSDRLMTPTMALRYWGSSVAGQIRTASRVLFRPPQCWWLPPIQSNTAITQLER